MSEAKNLKIVFFGTSSYAKKILESLVQEKYEVAAVFTRPDVPQGRKQEVVASPVKEAAASLGIPLYQPLKLDEEAIEQIEKTKPDLAIVASYGKILPRNILDIPKLGSLNIHASLLPKYRGPSPIQNVLLNGETETGVTIILMNQGIDTGDIISQEKVVVEEKDTAETLTQKLAEIGARLLLKTIPLWSEKQIKPQKQDDKTATVCQLIEKEDGRIIWENEAQKIYNQFRAFYVWPGIFTFWNNNGTIERIKLNSISLITTDPQTKHAIGEVFEIGEKIGVQTLNGVIILEQIQIAGKSPVSAKEFLNGYSSFLGSKLI
jgi:methionyl-tRNA formyltransferase